ncbi:MAG: hypothetical protein HYX27_07060 [Acidobacteria bacterium]|nr:hypothetical protein [Acidobacteriota bacterium]
MDRFVGQLVVRIGHEFPEKFEELGEGRVREFVRRGVDDGQKFRIRLEGALATFVVLRWQYGEQFELSPDRLWARDVLEHPQLPDAVKISLIADRFESRVRGRTIVKEIPRGVS